MKRKTVSGIMLTLLVASLVIVPVGTALIPSTISIALSSTTITLGSSVTIDGNVTAEDHTGRPNVDVTIQSRPVGAPYWNTVDTVKTDLNSNYTYTWTPGTGGTHEVRTRWDGDSETLGDESDVLILRVLYVFKLFPDVYVVIETNSTVSDFCIIPVNKEISFKVTGPDGTIGFCNVTIPKTLLTGNPWTIKIDNTTITDFDEKANATHTMLYFTYVHSIHKVQIFGTWVIEPPDDTPPSIDTPSQEPQPDNVMPNQAVTVSVNVTDADTGVRPDGVILSYSTDGGGTWNNVTMSKTTGDTYEGIIPGLPAGTQVRYMIIAYDNAGNYFVKDNVGLYYTYMVKPTPEPVGGKATPINIPMNKPETPTLWIWLTTIILSLVITVVYVKKRKRDTRLKC